MKAESTDKAPEFNLLKPEGVRPQADAGSLTAVLLDDGMWYPVEPGTFHLYQSAAKTPAFGPYATFVVSNEGGALAGMTVEVFPATVKGWAFP